MGRLISVDMRLPMHLFAAPTVGDLLTDVAALLGEGGNPEMRADAEVRRASRRRPLAAPPSWCG